MPGKTHPASETPVIRAVIFDLDGVLIDSEHIWESVRESYVPEMGGTYAAASTREIMGMSAPEWAHYIRVKLLVDLPEQRINDDVVSRVAAAYRAQLPIVPGAVAAVRRLGAVLPLAIASSSNRTLIDLFVELAGLDGAFVTTVSAEEAGRGKPAPDVYLLAAERLGVSPADCGAVEDSSNGIRSASAAGMRVVAIPHPDFPPDADALVLAHRVVLSVADVDVASFG
ncbi:MAG: HAD family phosphatase [Candidatus Eremiobacteraeota bacterium]|nr:HAD family phosphatase [Candidatus Eremiobacteraeota bacterium]